MSFMFKKKAADAAPPSTPRAAATTMADKWNNLKAEVAWRDKSEKIEFAKFLKDHKCVSFPTASEDDDYEAAMEDFRLMERNVLACGDEILEYQRAIRAFLDNMGAGLKAFSRVGAIGNRHAPDGSVEWTKAMNQTDIAFDSTLGAALEGSILPSLLRTATAMNEVHGHMQKRALLKLDFDYYSDKVAKLEADKEKRGGNLSAKAAQRLESNISKRDARGAEFETATAALLPVFSTYKRIGNRIVRAEFEAMKRAHAQVFAQAHEELSALDISAVPPAALPTVEEATAADVGGGSDDEGDAAVAERGRALLNASLEAPPPPPRRGKGKAPPPPPRRGA